jgi:ABC-type multidrug transport system fused ATPase/permease subunit
MVIKNRNSPVQFDRNNSVVRKCIDVLQTKDKIKVLVVVILQIFLAFLDLLAVATVGVLGALAVTGIQSRSPGDRTSTVLEYVHLENQTLQEQVGILGAVTVILLIARTIASVILTRRILKFLSNKGAEISSKLISSVVMSDLLTVQQRTIQEYAYALTDGVRSIVLGVIGSLVTLVTDISLLVVLAVGLVFVDPTVAIGTFFIFGAVAFILNRFMSEKAQTLGIEASEIVVRTNEQFAEVIGSYRENYVKSRRTFYIKELARLRFALADNQAESAFMPNVSKYAIETTVVIGAFTISGFQFLNEDATHAIATLAVFLTAGTRIAPAVLRIQQSFMGIRSGIGNSGPTLRIIEEVGLGTIPTDLQLVPTFIYPDFIPEVKIENVSFTYPGRSIPAISGIDLRILPGSSVAIVGSSGAGKTTLVDAMLGVIKVSEGRILISGKSPEDAIQDSPGAIGYVPQNCQLINGSVRENIALGYTASDYKDKDFQNVMRIAQVSSFVESLFDGLDSQVGDRGTRLSGGQRQRIGIARALFSNPKLLILDEATSSLDGTTESEITSSLKELKGKVTTIVIAHRLATVREVDVVIYMQEGKIVTIGTFDEIRAQIPDFDRQAKLMGIT